MRRCSLLWVGVFVAALIAGSVPAKAEDGPSPEQLKKMYDDALAQLKAAQDRKNELATENEKLHATVEQLKKDLAQATARGEELARRDAEHDEKTFFLRSHYAAWQRFMHRYPALLSQWKSFMGREDDDPCNTPDLYVPQWPLSSESAQG